MGVLTGNVSGSESERRRSQYEQVMNEIDVNKDGVVDYTEFITAAIDKVSVLNKVRSDEMKSFMVGKSDDCIQTHRQRQQWHDLSLGTVRCI